MGKRRNARVSEEYIEEEDEEMSEEQEFINGSSSSNEKSLYEVHHTRAHAFNFERDFCGLYYDIDALAEGNLSGFIIIFNSFILLASILP